GGPAVRHLHLLRVGDLALGLALHTVPFVRGHRALSTLRHLAPPFGGRGGRNGDNIIPPAYAVGAGLPGAGSEKPFRLLVASQDGLVAEPPQRHRPTTSAGRPSFRGATGSFRA